MISRYLLLLIFCVVCTLFGTAQTRKSGGLGYGHFGFALISTDNLEQVFGGSSDISTAHFASGGGGLFYYNRFLIGGSGYGAVGADFTQLNTQFQVTHGWGGLELGYDLSSTDRYKLLATALIGGRGTDINVESGPLKGVSLSNGSALFGLNLHLLTTILGDAESGMMMGVKFAASYSLQSSAWDGNPTITTPTAYGPWSVGIGLSIGGGGFGIIE